MTDPTTFSRRSPLRRAMEKLKAPQWRAVGDGALLDQAGEADAIGPLGIADLTPLPRLGFKGRGTLPAMRSRGVVVENEPNRAFRQPDGGLCLVLAATEVLLLGPLEGDGAGLDAFERSWRIEDGERTYPVPRRDSHAWFGLAGSAVPAMFAKLCGVDLRPHRFPDLSIAQTSVARLNAIVVRADHAGRPAYHLLADSAAAGYLLDCVLDAAEEFGGQIVGARAFIAGRPGEE
jgi:sarcosine oxidase subunit gamma